MKESEKILFAYTVILMNRQLVKKAKDIHISTFVQELFTTEELL